MNDFTSPVFVEKSAVPLALFFLGAKPQKSDMKIREFSFVFALFLMSKPLDNSKLEYMKEEFFEKSEEKCKI
jgi:hypothetical protein